GHHLPPCGRARRIWFLGQELSRGVRKVLDRAPGGAICRRSAFGGMLAWSGGLGEVVGGGLGHACFDPTGAGGHGHGCAARGLVAVDFLRAFWSADLAGSSPLPVLLVRRLRGGAPATSIPSGSRTPRAGMGPAPLNPNVPLRGSASEASSAVRVSFSPGGFSM